MGVRLRENLRESATRLRAAPAWQAGRGGYSAAIGTPIRLAQGRLRSLPHWKELARQTDALVLLIEGHGELAEDLGADIPGVAEGRERDRCIRKFMAA